MHPPNIVNSILSFTIAQSGKGKDNQYKKNTIKGKHKIIASIKILNAVQTLDLTRFLKHSFGVVIIHYLPKSQSPSPILQHAYPDIHS